ncbi:Uma2 family endonuclease [Nocardia sp. NPDC051832]|uniref:Uma2 family endonuclease n=1 Tax=Nocardia sp. NPDC051832 TaxID=3155673 RepID=UPI00342D6F50
MTAAEHLEEPIKGRMVLLPTPPPDGFTARDLPRLMEVVDGRFELLDGEVVMMAPSNVWHNEVVDWLKFELRRSAPAAMYVGAEQGINLGGSVPEPDLLVVSRAAVTDDSLIFQPADVHLAVEVVSPRTKTKDRVLRPAQYAEAGIKRFWRVEREAARSIVVYTFELRAGGYAPTGEHRRRLEIDRPFRIDIELPDPTY